MRRLASVAVGVLVLPLALAGCGGGDDGAGGDGRRTVKVGFQGPLSVNSPQLGINALNGVKVAVQQANDADTLPYDIELVEADDQGDPAVSPTAAQSLIDEDVVAVIGPIFSGATNAAEPLFAAAGTLSVSPSATNPSLTDPANGYDTFVRIISPDTVQGREAANYLSEELGAQRVYSLHDNSDYGRGLATALDEQLRANDVEVISEGVNPTDDYNSTATKVVGADPDAIYYSGYYQQTSLLVPALKSKGYDGIIMSGDGSNDDEFINGAGADAEGVYLTCACGDATAAAQDNPEVAQFVEAYREINNAEPGTYSGESYDAAMALIEVLRNLGDNPDKAAIIDAYKALNYDGLTKTISFDERGEVEDEQVYAYRVENGERRVLGLIPDLIAS